MIHTLMCSCGGYQYSRPNPQDRIHCRQLHMHYRHVTSLFYTVSNSHPLKVSRMGIKVSMIHCPFSSTAHIQVFLTKLWSGLVNNLSQPMRTLTPSLSVHDWMCTTYALCSTKGTSEAPIKRWRRFTLHFSWRLLVGSFVDQTERTILQTFHNVTVNFTLGFLLAYTHTTRHS